MEVPFPDSFASTMKSPQNCDFASSTVPSNDIKEVTTDERFDLITKSIGGIKRKLKTHARIPSSNKQQKASSLLNFGVMASVFAVIFLLLSALNFYAYKNRLELADILFVSHEPENLRECRKELTASAKALELEWKRSSQLVRKAFADHYSPTNDEDQAPNNLIALFLKHVEALRALPPTAKSENAVTARELEYRLVIGLLKATTHRLSGLAEVERLCDKHKIGSGVLGIPFPKLPPLSKRREQNFVACRDFAEMLKGRNLHFSAIPGGEEKLLPKPLAQRLADVLVLRDIRLSYDNLVNDAFSKVPEAIEKTGLSASDYKNDLLPLLHEGTKFNLRMFKQFRDRLAVMHEIYAPKSVSMWQGDWTEKSVQKNITLLHRLDTFPIERQKAMKRKLQDEWEDAVGEVPTDSVFSLAISLL